MAIYCRNDSEILKSYQIQMGGLRSFFWYSGVGAFVGLVALIALAISEAIFPNSKTSYLLSVVGVYSAGIVLSYVLQKKFTFHTSLNINQKKTFLKFATVALVGALVTTCFSYVLRYHLPWPQKLLPAAGLACFTIACLTASILTFYLNKKWVFKKERSLQIIDIKLNEIK